MFFLVPGPTSRNGEASCREVELVYAIAPPSALPGLSSIEEGRYALAVYHVQPNKVGAHPQAGMH